MPFIAILSTIKQSNRMQMFLDRQTRIGFGERILVGGAKPLGVGIKSMPAASSIIHLLVFAPDKKI